MAPLKVGELCPTGKERAVAFKSVDYLARACETLPGSNYKAASLWASFLTKAKGKEKRNPSNEALLEDIYIAYHRHKDLQEVETVIGGQAVAEEKAKNLQVGYLHEVRERDKLQRKPGFSDVENDFDRAVVRALQGNLFRPVRARDTLERLTQELVKGRKPRDHSNDGKNYAPLKMHAGVVTFEMDDKFKQAWLGIIKYYFLEVGLGRETPFLPILPQELYAAYKVHFKP